MTNINTTVTIEQCPNPNYFSVHYNGANIGSVTNSLYTKDGNRSESADLGMPVYVHGSIFTTEDQGDAANFVGAAFRCYLRRVDTIADLRKIVEVNPEIDLREYWMYPE